MIYSTRSNSRGVTSNEGEGLAIMLYYFCLNGPPKCGKSTLAREALRWFKLKQINAEPESFAMPIKAFTASLLGMPYSSIPKETPMAFLSGTTPREALISLSEDHMKVRYGNSVFGDALVNRWTKADNSSTPTVLVVDDCGFEGEFHALPRGRTVLVRINRPGYDFSGDSRSYIPKPDRTLINDGDLKRACSLIEDIADYAIDKWRLKK
jgi:hypothetical protein